MYKALVFRLDEKTRNVIETIIIPLWLAALGCNFAIKVINHDRLIFTFLATDVVWSRFLEEQNWLFRVLFDASMEHGLLWPAVDGSIVTIHMPHGVYGKALLSRLYEVMGLDPQDERARYF